MCASFKIQIIQRVRHLENQVCCSGDLVWLNMPESALDTAKTECLHHNQTNAFFTFLLEVTNEKELVGCSGLFPSAIIKTQCFLMRGAVLCPCLCSLPPRQEADSVGTVCFPFATGTAMGSLVS